MTKSAIVTGGSSGIGYAAVVALARDGFNIGFTYNRGEQRAQEIQAEIRKTGREVFVRQQDFANPAGAGQAVDDLVSALGRVDVLVNNAGVNRRRSFLDETLEEFEKLIAINLTAPFECGRRAARRMIQQKSGGRIINVTSILDREVLEGGAAYCVTKAGLRQLTRAMALELAPHGILVNGVAPGETATPMNFDQPVDAAAIERPVTPLKRPGYSQEIAETIAFLASNNSSYITGEVFLVDGGLALFGGPQALQTAVGAPPAAVV